jgi:predicted nucleic acid-binding protein
MIKPWVLDSGPLGRLAHPNPNALMVDWVSREIERGVLIVIPEIADYEVRRSFLLEGLARSVARLDELKAVFTYLPITTAIMLKASQLWAEARKRGLPTSHPHALDVDVILAAQTLQISGRVATENVGHLSLFVEASDWRTPPKEDS